MKKTQNKLLKYLLPILLIFIVVYIILIIKSQKTSSGKFFIEPINIEKEVFHEVKVKELSKLPADKTKDALSVSLKGSWSLLFDDSDKKLSAELPGDVHSALLKAGVIPEPFEQANEELVQWVGEKDWVYTREFDIHSEMMDYDSIFLNLGTVDTFSQIYINGQFVGDTANMFRRYRFEIKPFLKIGSNSIKIKLLSSVKKAQEQALAQAYPVPYSSNNKIPHMNLIRKVQCHAGWDWGICLAVTGIYGDISINAVNFARLEHVYTEQIHSKNSCKLKITAEVMASMDGETDFSLSIDNQKKSFRVNLKKGLNKINSELVIDNPRLWWPVGYGEQPLYLLEVKTAGQKITKKLGLRKLEVINKALQEGQGKGLTVRINDIDVFCKGANWIPVDAIPGRQTDEVYENLLSSAVDANMNMIRVWGGGQYEKDIFYRLCDEKGILVWQDLMFACSQYPATDEFILLIMNLLKMFIKNYFTRQNV